MKTISYLAVLLAAGGLRAAAPVVVEPLGPPGLPDGVPEYFVFAGAPVKIAIAVDAPLGAKVALFADLSQLVDGLAASLQAGLPVGGKLDFADVTHRQVVVEIPLPEVTKPIQVLVNFYVPSESGGKAPVAGRMILRVYPEPEPGAFGRLLGEAERAGGLRLAIFGPSPALRGFFKAQQIAFLDLGVEAPRDFGKDVVALGEITAAALAERRGEGRSVFFVSDSAMPPGIYRTASATGSVTKVTLPLLADLSTNPQHWKIFSDLLQQELNPAGSPSPLP